MPYTLRTGEMLAVMQNADMTHDARLFQAALESIGSLMADTLSKKFDLSYTGANYDLGMVASAFTPSFKGQPLPEAMAGFDDADEFR